MCVTIAACWWGSRFIVSAAWPVEPVIKSNVWWVPHSSPWLQNQLNGSIYFIYWINSILLCNRAHSELLLGLWNASDIASITGLILLEIPSSDIPAGILAPPVLGSSIYCVNCVYIGAAVIRMLPVCTCDSNIFMGFVAWKPCLLVLLIPVWSVCPFSFVPCRLLWQTHYLWGSGDAELCHDSIDKGKEVRPTTHRPHPRVVHPE